MGLSSTETKRLIRDGGKGGRRGIEVGKREIIYLSVHCHQQNDSCIKMGNEDSHNCEGQIHKRTQPF